jgi:hypothetical protein
LVVGSEARARFASAAARNIISGNSLDIFIRSGTNKMVQGNFIRTDATGTVVLSSGAGLDVRSSNNVIDGSSAAARRSDRCSTDRGRRSCDRADIRAPEVGPRLCAA